MLKKYKLFSPFDCYLLVTIFVKNITSVFEKRFSLFIEYGKINSTKCTVHAPPPPSNRPDALGFASPRIVTRVSGLRFPAGKRSSLHHPEEAEVAKLT